MLVDGFDLVVDLKKSQGCYLYDSRYNKRYLDFFSFFGSSAIGMNHPKMTEREFLEKLAAVAVNKPSNSDVYSVEMAEFVETFSALFNRNICRTCFSLTAVRLQSRTR